MVPVLWAEAGAAADELDPEAGDEAEPPVMGEAVPVPFWATAICVNCSWVLFTEGLMENTIALPQ